MNLGVDLDHRRVTSSAGWKMYAEFPDTLEVELGRSKQGKIKRDMVQFSKLFDCDPAAACEFERESAIGYPKI